jgi:hypothetical protein
VAVSGAPPGDRQRKPPTAHEIATPPAKERTCVGGLSALSLTGHGAKALVDNQGTTQARYYDLALRNGVPQVTG